jgi:hypothetical protein
MKFYSNSPISEEERQSILSQHKEIYNGYQTLLPKSDNTQPLYVQDYALDKQGATLNNKGTVKPYTNINIHEGHSMDQCEQCGGNMNEGECSECGWKMEQMDEQSISDVLKKGSERIQQLMGGRRFSRKVPYTAEAVQKILKQIYSAKTEEQLLSTMKMYDNLTDTNEDFLDVYKERINTAYRRKADELDFYLKKKDIKKALSEYETGKLDDIYNVSDLDDSSEFDYVEGDDNYQGSFEQQHKMKKLKSESATSNAPLSYGKHYNEIEEPYEFKSNGPVGDGGTLRQKPVNEVGFTGGGNAPDMDLSNVDPAYDFESEGPDEDTYTIPADDMDLDTKDEWDAYDFVSGGGNENGGDVYPVNEEGECEECWEKMESAWVNDEEIDEQDVSGVQGMYGDMDPAFNFVSTGAGKAGPYQTSDFPQGYEGENEDAYWEVESNEINPDKIDRDASWEEITASTGEDEFSHLDEEVAEKFIVQKNKIYEMMFRMKKFN